MKLLSRNVTVHKSCDEIREILRTCAHREQFEYSDGTFCVLCAKRNERGRFFIATVKGTVSQTADGAEVKLKLHGNVGVYLGAAFVLCGLAKLLIFGIMSLLNIVQFEYGGLFDILFGIIVGGFIALREVELLDLVEHKLTR